MAKIKKKVGHDPNMNEALMERGNLSSDTQRLGEYQEKKKMESQRLWEETQSTRDFQQNPRS